MFHTAVQQAPAGPSAEERALMKEKLKQLKMEEKRKMLLEKEAKREEMKKQIEEEKNRRNEEKQKVCYDTFILLE